MATRPDPAPADEIRRCARACAAYLVDHSYSRALETLAEVMCEAAERLQNQEITTGERDAKADAVVNVLGWLLSQALPACDGDQKRAATYQSLVSARRFAHVEDPGKRKELVARSKEAAELFFGDSVTPRVSSAMRDLCKRHARMRRDVAELANEWVARSTYLGARDPEAARAVLEGAYHRAERAIVALARCVDRSILHDPPIPRTVREWAEARVELERQLLETGHTSDEVGRLLPDGGTDTDAGARVRVRQSRARQA